MHYVVELEGFQLEKCFIVKELSICSVYKQREFIYLLEVPFDKKILSDKDLKTVEFCEKRLHKIQQYIVSRSKTIVCFHFTIVEDFTTVQG